MALVPLILDGFYESETLTLPEQECVNWYRVISKSEGDVSPISLRGGSGITQKTTTGAIKQVNRGAHVKADKAYFLNGESLVRIEITTDKFNAKSFSVATIGVIPGSDRVSMADNGKQLMVLVPGGDGFIIDETAGPIFQTITAPGFTAHGAPQNVTFNDSFFLVTTDSKRFIRSASNDGLSWSALDVFTAESDPDIITAIHTSRNKVYVGGSETIEEFNNRSGIYQRTGLFIDKGVFAPFSMISTNNSFMWIGGGTDESAAIWMLVGSKAVKVSTTIIDEVLQGFTDTEIKQAFAYSYARKGAYFVGFSLPTVTFEFNTITGKWNERKSQITDTKGAVSTVRWRVNSIATVEGLLLCGDSQDGRIGSIEPGTFSEYGDEIIRSVSIQPLTNLGEEMSIPMLEPTFKSGVGTEQTPDPKIRMSTSKNGKIFNDQTSRGIGKIGQYNRRSIWWKLGRFPRLALINFVMSDRVESEFIKLEADVVGGTGGG